MACGASGEGPRWWEGTCWRGRSAGGPREGPAGAQAPEARPLPPPRSFPARSALLAVVTLVLAAPGCGTDSRNASSDGAGASGSGTGTSTGDGGASGTGGNGTAGGGPCTGSPVGGPCDNTLDCCNSHCKQG